MNTPYEFGYEIGRLVKRADFSDDALEDEKAEVRGIGNRLGWHGSAQIRDGVMTRTPAPAQQPRGPVQLKPTVRPAARPAPRPAPNWLRSGLPKLPSGPTSSPDFKGAVE